MPSQIFVNLPVKDLGKSIAFFTALGFTFDQRFANDNGTCMVIGENIYAMLLVEPFFRTFTHKDICDTRTHTETLLALSLENREAVDAMVAKARRAGGAVTTEPRDHGFMYGHGFEDVDGHIWEVFYMDMSAIGDATAG